MKPKIPILLVCIFLLSSAIAQVSQMANNLGSMRAAAGELMFLPQLKPFYHGVASGDPLYNSIIIWTRVTPDVDGPVVVDWEMSVDTAFSSIVQSGSLITDAEVDYTVKVDINGLEEGTYYYYRFMALDAVSIIGRTKTAALDEEHMKFAVVSCNNYQSGYFNAFARLAERNDLDAIIHTGDFIYEYETGAYGYDEEVGREHFPNDEVIELADYRLRYSYYILDSDLRRVRQQHPFIVIWDDHETANDSWKDGAQNHQEDTEGSWEDRKAAGKQAYFEWLPIRDNPDKKIFRTFEFGDLASLTMLDTRLEGRVEQAPSTTDPTYSDTSRTILGEEQLSWFLNEIESSSASWNLIGNQVAFARILIDALDAVLPGLSAFFLDVWTGYPYEQKKVLDFIRDQALNNVVFLTGDVHVSIAIDVAEEPEDTLLYNPETGEGSLAVEFITPSITSDNYDELFEDLLAGLFDDLFKNTHPHRKYNDFTNHGYFILDLTPERAQADYYFSETIKEPSDIEYFDKGVYTLNGDNFLQLTDFSASPKDFQAIPAPDPTIFYTSIEEAQQSFAVLNLYPNPASQFILLNYALNKGEDVKISLFNNEAKIQDILFSEHQNAGNYSSLIDLSRYPSGMYILYIQAGQSSISRKIILAK